MRLEVSDCTLETCDYAVSSFRYDVLILLRKAYYPCPLLLRYFGPQNAYNYLDCIFTVTVSGHDGVVRVFPVNE